MLNVLLKPFLTKHSLADDYISVVENWFLPLAEDIVLHQKRAGRPLVIGINGAQGSGKTTLADLLVFLFQHHFQLDAISLSIDDFYLTQQERALLAGSIHPLLKTRGVPGTHDVELALSTLDSLLKGETVAIPRFNKAVDDRHKAECWDKSTKPVQLIIVEGWCLGAVPQSHEQLADSANELEDREDSELVWRSYINQQLINHYPRLYDKVDQWVMLKAPSFDCVYTWRLEQEQKLKARQTGKVSGVMTDDELKRFIRFYQRVTEHVLADLPAKVNYLFELDKQRNIINFEQQHSAKRLTSNEKRLLIYSDMDGSLLDHYSYDFSVAKPTLSKLKALNVPVIPCTSKTSAELIELRQVLDNHCPFIAENGAVVYIPVGTFAKQPDDTVKKGQFWIKSFTQPRTYWLSVLEKLKPRFDNYFRHFNQMTIDDIAKETGLTKKEAANASLREYGEPVRWLGNDEMKAQFIQQLEEQGAVVLEGGRFIHISGEVNKAMAMSWLTALYQKEQSNQTAIKTLAIGDSNNDVAMLNEADMALIIRSPVNALPKLNRKEETYISEHIAPLGWKQGVEEILRKLDYSMEKTHG